LLCLVCDERSDEVARQGRSDGIGDGVSRGGREGLDAKHLADHYESDDLSTEQVQTQPGSPGPRKSLERVEELAGKDFA
jgi:hypothetical protein